MAKGTLQGCPANAWITGLAMENCEEEQPSESCIPCARLDRSVLTHQEMLLSHSLIHFILCLFLK